MDKEKDQRIIVSEIIGEHQKIAENNMKKK